MKQLYTREIKLRNTLLVLPFLILPLFALLFRALGGLLPFSFSGAEYIKTVYNIFFIVAFLCCLPVSALLKRAARSAYIVIFLLYNAVLIPLLQMFL